MLSKALILLGICLMVSADRIHFDGYKVFRIIPKNEDEAKVVQELENQGLPFWSGPNPVGRASDIMFPPHMQGDIIEGLQNSGIDIKEFISDVEKLVVEQDAGIQDDVSARVDFNFGQYHTLASAYSFLDQIAAEHSSIARTSSIGNSFEGRELKMLTISKGGGGTKPAIWFDANIHAREWITSAVCMYVVNELLTSTNPVVQQWTQDYDWYILCHHNPDGFEFARTTTRMWRKTRSTRSGTTCRGADPNRNFAFHWLGGGSSTDPCSDTYAGSAAFSEPETKAASDFQTSLGSRLKFVLSLHSYSQYILIPYGVRVPFPPHNEYMRIGQLTAAAIQRRYNTRFVPGNIVDLLYVASGGSGDWAHGVRNVDLTYTFEMRDTGLYGFLLPATQIIPSSLEFMDGLEVMVRELGGLLAKKEAAKLA